MSQQLFDEEEMVEKKVQVKDIENKSSFLGKFGLPDISVPSVQLPDSITGKDIFDRKFFVVAVELLLVIYLALGYAGLVPLF